MKKKKKTKKGERMTFELTSNISNIFEMKYIKLNSEPLALNELLFLMRAESQKVSEL